MYSLKHIKLTNLLGIVCLGAFAFLMLMAISPNTTDGASAEEAQATINLHAKAAVSIALDNSNIDMEITPRSGGTFSSNQTKVKIETNNTSGYRLLMGTSNNQSTLANVKDNSKVVKSITGNDITASDFSANTWGYNLVKAEAADGKFSAVPGATTEILATAGANLEAPDIYTLAFGAKIDASIPAGTYTNQVVLSAVANPLELTNMMDLVYMQDMTPELCVATPISEDLKSPLTKQLIDTRDGKAYYVAKLADGNCWMTQNLDLDITAQMIAQDGLNNLNTDLHSGSIWGRNIATGTTDGNSTCVSGTENVNCLIIDGKAHYVPFNTAVINQEYPLTTAAQDLPWGYTMSWDVGKWVLRYPTQAASSGLASTMEDCANGNGTDKSPDYVAGSIVDVSAPEWKGTWSYQEHGTAVNDATHEYDPHYLVGNYYQWNTATAGSGGSNGDVNATDSICPKGWKLPTSGDMTKSNNLLNGSVYNQLAGYGLTAEINPAENKNSNSVLSIAGSYTVNRRTGVGGTNSLAWPTTGVTVTTVSVATAIDARTIPLYLPYSGNISPYREGGKLIFGRSADFWSSTGSANYDSGRVAWLYGLDDKLIEPAMGTWDRTNGYTVRCLAW